jgi:hypothetical protein
MNTFEQISSSVVWSRTGMASEESRCLQRTDHGPEVGIRRDENTLFAVSVLKNRYVIRSREPKIPHVNCIMVRLPQAFCDDR